MPSVASGLLDIRKNGSPSLEEHRRLIRSDSDDSGKKDVISLPSDQSTTSTTSSASSSSFSSDNEEITSNGKRQKVYDDGHSSFLKAVTQLILNEWKLLESSGDDDEFSKKNSLIVEFKQPEELEVSLLSITHERVV